MKTLVNKSNPSIRITAPEIEDAAVYGIDCKTLHSTHLYLFREDWTLVEEGMLPGFEDEEPTEGLGITETCVPPIIVETLNRFGWKVEKGYVEEEPEVDLEKEIDFYIGVYFLKCEDGTLLNADGDELRYTDVRKIAKHFYELGKGGSK